MFQDLQSNGVPIDKYMWLRSLHRASKGDYYR